MTRAPQLTDAITKEDVEFLQVWANRELSDRYPDYSPDVSVDRSDLQLWRPEPVHVALSDVATFGDFVTVLKVVSKHLDRVMRKVADEVATGPLVEIVTTIRCNFEDAVIDSIATDTFVIVGQIVVRKKS